jgi:hypothetical protein
MTFDDVVRIATELPGVEEGSSYGTRALRVQRRFMCRLREDGDTFVLKPVAEIEQEMLMATQPDVFYLTPHYQGYNCILIRLSRVSETDLRALIEQSWSRLASKRLLALAEHRQGTRGLPPPSEV